MIAFSLRLVLIAVLVLNGLGSSIAGTRMALAGAAPGQASMAHAGHAAPHGARADCHRHQADAASATTNAATAAGSERPHSAPGCCPSQCDCACFASTPAALVSLQVLPLGDSGRLDRPLRSPSRPSPALLHPHRPPIG